ncbi:MAG: hypothetical protein AAB373_03185 [Patescibacteria group bacterium]
MKKILLWSGGILIFLILGVGYLFFFYPDEELKSFKELELNLPNISEEENGYKYLIQAYEAFKLPEAVEAIDYGLESDGKVEMSEIAELFAPAEEDDYGKLMSQIYGESGELVDLESMPDFYPFLKLNSEALILMDKANEFDYIIQDFDLANTDLNYLVSRGLMIENSIAADRLLVYRALYTLQQGDQNRAMERIFALIDFHNKKLLFPNSLIGYLMNNASIKSVFDVLDLVLETGDLSKEDYQKLLNYLNDFEPNFTTGWENAVKIEFNTNMNYITALKKIGETSGGFFDKSRFHFQVNKTKNAFAERFKKMIDDPFYSFEEEDSLLMRKGSSMLFSQNSVGKAIMYGFLPSLFGCKPFITTFDFNSMRLLVAIKLYEIENGEVPDRLEDLVPGYFEDLEWLDFNGERMINYKPTGILYSDFLVKNCNDEKSVKLLK